MDIKVLEIRDRMTCIPALAVNLVAEPDDEAARYLLSRAGFWQSGAPEQAGILLVHLERVEVHSDPFDWRGGRTMHHAHRHIIANWSTLATGDVVDVRVVLGETETAATPERLGRGDSI